MELSPEQKLTLAKWVAGGLSLSEVQKKLNEEFGMAVGADAYCRDAGVAVETALALIAKKRAAA